MKPVLGAAAVMALTIFPGGAAFAQVSPRSPLLDLPVGSLRGELDTRYNAVVAASKAADVVRAEDSRFFWASEAKVQCGIAIGFTKAGIKDPDSVNKCDLFSQRLNGAPPATVAPPTPVAAGCPANPVVEVFFEWNIAEPNADAGAIVQQIAQNREACGWGPITVTGHTDRSGTDLYNNGLSMRRANNIAAMLVGMGVPQSDLAVVGTGEAQMKVETVDGVREPANRRVEITAQPRGQ
jgi:outer membrane protein OmpA-like peptidoglycan-associated protein